MKVIPAVLTLAFLAAAPASARAEDPGLTAARAGYMRDRIGLMAALTTWGALNVGAGAVLWATAPPEPTRRTQRRWFALMAVAYGLVNGALAINTLATLGKTRAGLTSLGEVAEQRRQSADVFAFNVGLDMLSVGIGASIWAASPSPTAQGAGASVTAQGLFLVGFDTIGSVVYRR